ncbi:MAG: hypothetical protein JXR65_01745 [Bacteroidales bacterium]|nr:hypothetical protein [Bacteroidales bacterium]
MHKTTLKYPIFLFVIFCSLLWENPVLGQNLSQTKPGFFNSNWNIGLNVGINQFYGDVNNHTFLQKISKESPLGAQLYLTKMIHSSWGLGINLNYAGIKSIKDQLPDGTQVSFSLSGMYYSANSYLYLNFNDLIFGYQADRFWALYVKAGVGYALWNTTLTNDITGTAIKSGETVGDHTYAKQALEVPLTAGLRFRLSARMSLDLGVEFNTILNDDVDLWNEGYKYDRFTYVYGGLSYSFGNTHRSKRSDTDQQPSYVPKGNIPLVDYTFFSSPDKSLNKNTGTPPADVLQIDQPVAPPSQTKNVAVQVVQTKKPQVNNNPGGLEFRVQIMAADKKVGIGVVQAKFNLTVPVEEVYQNGYYRYTVGHFSNYQSALSESRKMRAQRVYDAFVTAYKDGLRIPLTSTMMK